MWNKLVECASECGSQDALGFGALRLSFRHLGAHWYAMYDRESKLVKVLTSSVMRPEKTENKQLIKFDYLAIYSLLLCQGSYEEKSKILFHILQAGEIQANSTIRRDCPDFKRVFQKMLKFATLYIFEFVRHFGQGGNRYDKNITAIRNAIEAEGKGSLLSEVKDKIFGKSQTVSFQKWEAAIRTECAWIFDVRSCRAKVLKQCKLM